MQVLQFSGGRDSLACLYLLEPQWADLTVAWVNTGAAFPETLEQMREVQRLGVNFVEIKSEQSIDAEGYPADVVPVASTSLGQTAEGVHGRRFQSRYACCGFSLWVPMYRAMHRMGAKVIIRGQKRSDGKKSPIKSGDVIDGIRYEFPLDDWTDQDVTEYLAGRGVEVPRNYALMSTGLDCWNCSAYLDENAGKLEYMRQFHPEKHAHMQGVLSDLQQTLHRDMAPLRDIKASYS